MKQDFITKVENVRERMCNALTKKLKRKKEIELEESISILVTSNSFSETIENVEIGYITIEDDDTIYLYDADDCQYSIDDIVSLEDLAILVDTITNL